jgi:acyl-CoA hydrolase
MSDIQSVSWQQSKVQMTQIVLPSHTNNHGTAFGGQIAAWCDICAAVSAQRFCRSPVVTASMDELHFGSPIKRGMVVILDANVNRAWRSSMEVGVRVTTEDPITGVRALCCEAFLTFVAIDDAGSPVSVPTLDIESDSDAQVRFGEAQARRDARLAARAKRSVV